MPKMPAFDPLELPQSNGTGYPPPYDAAQRRRFNRRLGNHAGLTQFGVNLTRIEPGGQSSARHAHDKEDEFIWVLEGEAVLVTDAGEQVVGAGMCVGFACGTGDAHHFLNRTDRDVLLLVVGSRAQGEVVRYPDIDLHLQDGAFHHKDGRRYR